MKNSCLPAYKPFEEANVVYQYTCNIGECIHLNSRYIGQTSKKLAIRLSQHVQSGAIKEHHMSTHQRELTRGHLNENTITLDRQSQYSRRLISEALYIQSLKPSINIQQRVRYSLPSLGNHPPPEPTSNWLILIPSLPFPQCFCSYSIP